MRKSHSISWVCSFAIMIVGNAKADSAKQIKKAITNSLSLIQHSIKQYHEHRQCFSCHHQAIPTLTLAMAKKHGYPVDESLIQKEQETTSAHLERSKKKYLNGTGTGGGVDTAGYALWTLEAAKSKPDEFTAAVVEYLLKRDKKRNHWRCSSNRPPSEASNITTTALALRGIDIFGTEEQQSRIKERIKKVRQWMIDVKPKDTEDHVFRLQGLYYLDVKDELIESGVTALLKLQRKDGGWAQKPDMESDAYATGTALVTLKEVGGIDVSNPVYQRGMEYLLKTQRPDGSWYVNSRSKPFQKYFESGFPHKKDQFISITASGWATQALILAAKNEVKKKKTNVVLIVTDNHGAWTLGCYGNKDIKTPHLDQLAKEGVRFDNAYACNAVCSPTRASILTGLMPSGHGVHCFLRARNLQTGPNAKSTMDGLKTLSGILHENGYTCGLVGKWHLGDNLKPQCGFSSWVTMPHGGTLTFYDAEVIEKGKTRKEPQYLTTFWTERGCKFIDENKDKPFFLMLSYNGPYGLGRSMTKPPKNRHAEYYKDHPLKSFPRTNMHPWLHSTKNLFDNPTSRWRYAAEVSAVDDGVGEIMKTLKKHHLDEDTLIVFIGDQGLSGGHGGFWGMGDHTRPLTGYDCQLQIPLIIRHKKSIKANQVSDDLVSNYDMMPTILDHVQLKKQIPEGIAGQSLTSTLHGKSINRDAIYYEFENVRAVRTKQWKYIERYKQTPNELYHIVKDPEEKHNLIDSKTVTLKRNELQADLKQFFTQHANPKFDIWQKGKSKSHLLMKSLFESNQSE